MDRETERRLAEDEARLRDEAIMSGDVAGLSAHDRMVEAEPLMHSKQISPLAYWLCGCAERAAAEGEVEADWIAERVAAHDAEPEMCEKIYGAIEQLRRQKLWPKEWTR